MKGFSNVLRAQQRRVDTENAQRQKQWQNACAAIAEQRAAAVGAKAAAETQLATARTQQAAERAEAAMQAAIAAVTETAELKVPRASLSDNCCRAAAVSGMAPCPTCA